MFFSIFFCLIPLNVIHNVGYAFYQQHENEPEGCVFLSKCSFRTSSAWGVNDVRRLRFFDGSLPMNSERFCMPFLYRSSASAIQRSRTGLIFWALLGVMSNFSNLDRHKNHN